VSEHFGESDPRVMPRHFFWGALHLEFESALKADVSKQNYSVCPRYWYIDATFHCLRCGREFCFTADEQRHWYEERQFYVDSQARHCVECRHARRELRQRRQEYDRQIAAALQSDDLALKQRLAEVIDELYEFDASLPEKINENRRILAQQIENKKPV
jgi:hypothetical protein